MRTAALFICSFLIALTMLCKTGHAFLRISSNKMQIRTLSMSANAQANTFIRNSVPTVAVTAAEAFAFSGDLLVIPFYKPSSDAAKKDEKVSLQELKDSIPAVSADIMKLVSDILDEEVFKADASSKQLVRVAGGSGVKYVALVGMGPKKDSAPAKKLVGTLGTTVSALAKEVKAEKVGLVAPEGVAEFTPFVLAMQDGLYEDTRFKKEPEGGFPKIKWQSLELLGCSAQVVKDISLTQQLTGMIASGVHFTKDLVGAPPCSASPVAIAEQAILLGKEHNMEVKVLGEEECNALGMGAYLGVQQGSKFPPQFVHITYKADNPGPDTVKVCLVGKGLTFDSGGYNLKVGAGSMIELMKFDMGGCGAVLGAAKSIGLLKPKNLEVHFITALCENMISTEAMRPGDILVASNKKTIEVLNTDAEGRLTLADALVYAEKLEPDTIIDLATLTGACIVGLGEQIAALYSPDDDLLKQIQSAGKRTEELMWHMPLEESYRKSVKGTLTDLKNIAGQKGGGSITAALFLQEFVEKTPWAHIDMAGPVWIGGKPTGYGVKLLVDYLLNAKKVA
mmetsp:Transcript_5183/g.11886  ORF Transcript_5183/g.11886 Transcript_5183/m.11886 type:complete len:565 (+) Transcript_5183:61-1755(+)